MYCSKHIILYTFISLFSLFTDHPARANSGKYSIQNFTPYEYRAGIQNIDFAQNRDMTLFVANNLGVLSFNGNQWKTHNFKTGIKKRSLAFDQSNNRLYVGSQGEFGYFDRDWNYESLLDKIPEHAPDFDEVWDVFLHQSEVFFCTFQGIYVFDGQNVEVIENEDGLERSFKAGGKLFTQNQQGELFEVESNRLVRSFPQKQINQIIAGIIPKNEGYLLFYNSGQIEFTTPYGVTPKYDDLIQSLKGTYVNHVLQLSDTRLVISTQTSGLFIYDTLEDKLEKISKQDGLETNACLRAFQDYAGNLWVGMQNGIALININSPMRLINIQGSGYEAIETNDGMYYTTSNGIHYKAKNTEHSVFLPGTEGPAYGFQEIAGKLYAGHHTGLFLLEQNMAIRLVQTDGLWKVIQLRSKPDFALGGTYSGLYLFKINEDQPLKAVQRITGFEASSRFFEEDRLGKIWVGQYYKGLYQVSLSDDLTKATEVNISEVCDLPVSQQIILSQVADNLYLATNTGIYQLDPINCVVSNTGIFAEVVGEQPVYLFAQDQKNNVHILAENTVGFFKQISANNYHFNPSSLYQLRYHLNNDLLHISVNIDHGILFSANEGFIHYDPLLEDPLKVKKSLVVNQVFSVTENKTLYGRKPFEDRSENIGSLVISPRAKVLKIDIESFQFNNLNNQQFRYWLKGFEEKFGEWVNATTKEYTNLRAGNYTFLAQSRNYLGNIASTQELVLIVKPPFYKSNFAKFLYVVIGISLLSMVSSFQKRRYNRKAEKIEKDRRLELVKKQQKLLEIEKQKEQELLQLQDEKIKTELRHVNNLLAASTMNLVVKNEFMETIKEELKEVNRKGKNIETRQTLEKIAKEIDVSLRLQEDWEQFEYHFDQVHGDFLSRLRKDFFDLSPNEQKLCAFLRLNLNTKEIANLMSISQRGVEVARYRLRRKLRLEKGQNLSKFILEY